MIEDDDIYDEFGNLIENCDEKLSQEYESEKLKTKNNTNELNQDNESDDKNDDKLKKKNNILIINPVFDKDNVVVIDREKKKDLIIEYTEQKSHGYQKNGFRSVPSLKYDRNYMINIINEFPDRIRNIAITGNMNSGKTMFLDMFIYKTHDSNEISQCFNLNTPLKYTDNHKQEISRGISIKCSPLTLLLENMNGTSFVFNILDVPGHISFSDEMMCAINSVDGIILVVDVVEGITFRDKDILTKSIKQNLPIILVINKIDRLILELKLPVSDSYFKIKKIIHDINEFIENNEYFVGYSHKKIKPVNDNVLFSSSFFFLTFSIFSFSKLYFSENTKTSVNLQDFSEKLWGDVFYNPDDQVFTTDSNNGKYKRTFISFILEPIYKIFTYSLTSDINDNLLKNLLLNNFKVTLDSQIYKLEKKKLLKNIFFKIFYNFTGFVDLTSKIVKTSNESILFENSIKNFDFSKSNLIAKVIKLIESSDGKKFYSLVRIYKGKIKVGSRIKIFGENFFDDSDNFSIELVDEIYLPEGRYRIPVQELGEGSFALIPDIDSIITKGATIYSSEFFNSNIKLFKKIDYTKDSVFKIAIEPADFSKLPELLESLKKINKCYLACSIKVEESGDHVILTPGELYLDCLLYDLRFLFGDNLEIKLSDPMTRFSETCTELSFVKINSKNESKDNEISIVAEPINDLKLSYLIEEKKISLKQPKKIFSKILREQHGWNASESMSVWCFGPDDLKHPSLLIDDTLEDETDKPLLNSIKDTICLGFRWCVNEGPLCGEPIRNTKFKLLDFVLDKSPEFRNATQIVPLSMKACFSGFLTASPRLMEPLYKVHVVCVESSIILLKKILKKRRGYVINQNPIPGTFLFQVEGIVPVIESFGLDSDFSLHAHFRPTCFLQFDKWEIVPGDPLDQDCILPTLEPVPFKSLARDFMLKTRRRKGLTGEPSLQKYIDSTLYKQIKSTI